MVPMQPAPRRPTVEEVALDEVIERIDQSLPVIHRMCRVQKKQKKSPTDRLPAKQEAQRRLKELSEDPILTDSGDDIAAEPLRKINGFHADEET